jgi:hypothetical protein
MCCNKLSAMGDRTLLNPHANKTDCGLRAPGAMGG